ncbi:EF-hand calcium-binding domain-containing protein 11-like isoform X1 [Diaphorina citri]|uniref:EF-hand calcium-binding domain-containing protein 11-like isoform X1 n=1 Tax=Diaphorina citri TaxID=121845 RepID=A0A3Q0JFT0_DIACI|nr:EF-hand calcium-binding domain-containing protein 11-like isoform X1 [Diaphorina citri]
MIPFLILKEDLSSIPCLLSIFSLPSLHQVFTSSLKPNENLMDSEDYKVASIILWGQKPKKTEMLTVFGSVKPYRHRLDFSEFQCIVTHKMRSLPMEYNIALLFNLIDEEDKHFITLADLLKVFGQHFPAVSQQILKEIFTHLDSNHTGRLHFSKFCAFLKK